MTLFEDDAFLIGKAFAEHVLNSGGKTIAIARDGRLSSPILTKHLIEGVTSSGVNVVDIGLVPTPLLYFTVHTTCPDGGIIVTGSHNPKSHNGFKFMLGKSPFFGEQILSLTEKIKSQTPSSNIPKGQIKNIDIIDSYITLAFKEISFKKSLKIAWDCGNGATGVLIKKLTDNITGTHFVVGGDVDGNFPSRPSDPTKSENLHHLKETILTHNCDLGIAFDGDGDRVVILDDKTQMISGDQLLYIISKDILTRQPKSKIIVDVKCSDYLIEKLQSIGAEPIMSRTGHPFIKEAMLKEKSPLAGELSGHMFFADRWFGFDDGIYAAIRVIELLSKEKVSLSTIFQSLPKTYAVPETHIRCEDSLKFSIVDSILTQFCKQKTGDEKINLIDGIRVSTPKGWWLIRASNTEAAIVIRAESTTKDDLNDIVQKLNSILRAFDLKPIHTAR